MNWIKEFIQNKGPYLVSFPVHWLLSLVSASNWHVHIGPDVYSLIKDKQGTFILSFWHSRILLPMYFYQWSHIGAFISQSKDGEYITQLAERFGYVITRGSASKRSVGGLVGLLHGLKSGRSIIITPDGPRGPRECALMGVIHLGKMSGLPITPICFSCTRNIRLKSWDRFMIPLPFGTMYTIVGNDIVVDSDSGHEAMEQKRRELQAEMRRISRIVDEKANTYIPPKDEVKAVNSG